MSLCIAKGERFESTSTLDLKTHIKATTKQLYVHSTSYHPPAIIKAIAKGETKKYLRTQLKRNQFQLNDSQINTQTQTERI